MSNRRVPLFFAELEGDYEYAFFWDIEKANRLEERRRVREEKYWARRKRNIVRALYYHRRMKVVEKIDPWKMTAHIEPDFFGSKATQFEAVKKLTDRKSKMLWVLKSLYHYLAFDEHLFEVTRGKKISYVSYRRVYESLLDQHREKIRQAKWDAKKAKVRARRRKKAGITESVPDPSSEVVRMLTMQYGSARHRPPAPLPLLEMDDWD